MIIKVISFFRIDITHIFNFFLFVTFISSPVFGQENSNNNVNSDREITSESC
jgi:hypothetical protein